jgi:hypothetical protein
MQRFMLAAGTIVLTVLALLVSGCGHDSAAANQVDVAIHVEYGIQYTYPYPSPGMVYIGVVLNQGGFPLEGKALTENESFACNGLLFSVNRRGPDTFGEQLPDTPSYNCRYTRDGVTTQISLTEPQRLSILSPTPHSIISRSGQGVQVRFAPALTASQMSLIASISAHSDTIGNYVSAPSGTNSVVVPVSDVSTSVDTAYLYADQWTPIATTPSAFHSLAAFFADGVRVPLAVA